MRLIKWLSGLNDAPTPRVKKAVVDPTSFSVMVNINPSDFEVYIRRTGYRGYTAYGNEYFNDKELPDVPGATYVDVTDWFEEVPGGVVVSSIVQLIPDDAGSDLHKKVSILFDNDLEFTKPSYFIESDLESHIHRMRVISPTQRICNVIRSGVGYEYLLTKVQQQSIWDVVSYANRFNGISALIKPTRPLIPDLGISADSIELVENKYITFIDAKSNIPLLTVIRRFGDDWLELGMPGPVVFWDGTTILYGATTDEYKRDKGEYFKVPLKQNPTFIAMIDNLDVHEDYKTTLRKHYGIDGSAMIVE